MGAHTPERHGTCTILPPNSANTVRTRRVQLFPICWAISPIGANISTNVSTGIYGLRICPMFAPMGEIVQQMGRRGTRLVHTRCKYIKCSVICSTQWSQCAKMRIMAHHVAMRTLCTMQNCKCIPTKRRIGKTKQHVGHTHRNPRFLIVHFDLQTAFRARVSIFKSGI